MRIKDFVSVNKTKNQVNQYQLNLGNLFTRAYKILLVYEEIQKQRDVLLLRVIQLRLMEKSVYNL